MGGTLYAIFRQKVYARSRICAEEPLGERSIFNAAAGIGRQAHIFIRLEGRDPFDQPDGADGN